MKKYFQIVFVSTVFFVAIFLKDKIKIGADKETTSDITKNTNSIVVTPTPVQIKSSKKYSKDGDFVGEIVDAHYGNVQVQATIENGEISAISFLEYPSENRTSEFINTQAMPILQQEAIAIQDSRVDIVTGASHTSLAFRKSLSQALSKAL